MNLMGRQPASEPRTNPPLAPRPRVSSNWWLFAVFLLCIGVGLGRMIGSWPDRAPGERPARADQAEVASGPWGTLQITKIAIERPDEFINRDPCWIRVIGK
jgi:hypothetical protein